MSGFTRVDSGKVIRPAPRKGHFASLLAAVTPSFIEADSKPGLFHRKRLSSFAHCHQGGTATGVFRRGVRIRPKFGPLSALLCSNNQDFGSDTYRYERPGEYTELGVKIEPEMGHGTNAGRPGFPSRCPRGAGTERKLIREPIIDSGNRDCRTARLRHRDGAVTHEYAGSAQ